MLRSAIAGNTLFQFAATIRVVTKAFRYGMFFAYKGVV